MDLNQEGWSSFWDIATPEAAAAALVWGYEDHALTAAHQCFRDADLDNRPDDRRFWQAVMLIIDRSEPAS